MSYNIGPYSTQPSPYVTYVDPYSVENRKMKDNIIKMGGNPKWDDKNKMWYNFQNPQENAPTSKGSDTYGGKTYTEWQKTATNQDWANLFKGAKERNHPYEKQPDSYRGRPGDIPVGTPAFNMQGKEITYRDRYDPSTGKTYKEMLADGKQVRYWNGQTYVPSYKYQGPTNNDWDWKQYHQDRKFKKSTAGLKYGGFNPISSAPNPAQIEAAGLSSLVGQGPQSAAHINTLRGVKSYGMTPAEWEAEKARQAQAYANLQASRAPQTNPYDIPRSEYNPHGDYSAEGFAPPDNDPTGAQAPLANVQPQPVGAPINYDPQQQPHQPYTQVPPDAHQQGSGTTTGPLNPPPPQELPTYTYQGQAYTPGPEMEMLRAWRNRR